MNRWTEPAKIIAWSWPALISIGLAANLLTLVTFSRKKFSDTFFSVYSRFLCIIDSLVLTLNLFYFVLDVRDDWETRLDVSAPFLCPLASYVIYLIPAVSAHVLVAISTERFVSISCPNRFLFHKKRKFQMWILLAISAFNLVYYLEPLVSVFKSTIRTPKWAHNNSLASSCEIKVDLKATHWLSLVNSAVVPFSLMISLSCLTIKALFDSRQRVNSNSLSEKRDRKFALVSIATNLLFLLLVLPFLAFDFIRVRNKNKDQLFAHIFFFLFLIAKTFYLLNFGSQFFVNWAFNSLFRDEIRIMLGFKP
jgi:hypothetical protein